MVHETTDSMMVKGVGLKLSIVTGTGVIVGSIFFVILWRH